MKIRILVVNICVTLHTHTHTHTHTFWVLIVCNYTKYVLCSDTITMISICEHNSNM